MFEYIVSENFSSLSNNTVGFCDDFSQVKKENLSQTPECMHYRSTYPNGFIIESEQYSDRIILRSNWILEQNSADTWFPRKPQ